MKDVYEDLSEDTETRFETPKVEIRRLVLSGVMHTMDLLRKSTRLHLVQVMIKECKRLVESSHIHAVHALGICKEEYERTIDKIFKKLSIKIYRKKTTQKSNSDWPFIQNTISRRVRIRKNECITQQNKPSARY